MSKLIEAALALSTAMIEAEAHGADFSTIDDEWAALTEALEEVLP